jgi:molybdate transport system ATP-binding protein
MGMISAAIALRRGEFHLDVRIESENRRLAIFGQSGAGKTTFLDAVAGLVRPERGMIAISGKTLFDARQEIDLPPRMRGVGYVRQTPDLFPAMTVSENISFARSRRMPGKPAIDAGEVEKALGIAPLSRRRPRELSGGETRRVQIARALASQPSVLLLDEPFANLDASARREILPLLGALPTRFAVPAILVTHDAEEVFAFAEEAVVLEGGRVVAQGEPLVTLSRPGSWPVARISGVENFLAVHLTGPDEREGGTLADWSGVRVHCPAVRGSPGDAATLALFAEDVLIARGSVEGLSARNAFPMRVESVVEDGDTLLVSLSDGPRRLQSRITRGARADLKLEANVVVTALFKSAALRVLAR